MKVVFVESAQISVGNAATASLWSGREGSLSEASRRQALCTSAGDRHETQAQVATDMS